MTVRSKRPGRSRLRLASTLLALAALVLLGVVLAPWSKRTPEPERKVAADVPAPPAPTRTTWDPVGTGRRPPSRWVPDGSAPESLQPEEITPEPLPSAAFPYPPGSQPLTEGTNPAKVAKQSDPVDVDKGIDCLWGPRTAVVHPDDPIVIDLQVVNRLGASLPISDGVARVRPDHTDRKTGPWFPAPLVDDGSGADLAAVDNHYTATLQPTAEQKAAMLAGGAHVYVDVSFVVPSVGGNRHAYVMAMQYSREPNASLNGKYTESVSQGSLVIGAGVTVKVAGEYRVLGSLYAGEQAIAIAQQSTTLPVGDGSIPLLFFGKILYDRGLDGPYTLRFEMLFEHTNGDDIPGDTVDPAYTTTQAYRAKSFSDGAYVAPAASFAVVDQNSPSQQDKPPPLISEADRDKLNGETAPIRPDTPRTRPVPTGTK